MLHFLPYQQKFINDKSRLKILVKGRRTGGTFCTSYVVFKRLMETRNHDITVVTRDERLAKDFVLNVKKWFQFWNAIQKDANKKIPNKAFKSLEIEIPHADGPSRLIAVSSNPDAAIGKGGDVILDEFAVHKDAELLWKLAQPIILAGGNCTILSTQRGRNSKFNEIVQEAETDPNSEWSLHKTTIEDAVDQGLVEEIVNPTLIKLNNEPFETREDFIKWLKRTVDEHTYAQEYMCIPSEEGTDLLKESEIKRAFEKMLSEGSVTSGQIYMGWDIAESEVGDFAAICVLKVTKDSEVEIIYSHYFEKGTAIDDQIEFIKDLNKEYHPYKIVCDENGIGRYPTAVLKKKIGNKVIGFTSTLNSKAEGYTKVKRFFENDKVRMVKDEQIKEDFLSIQRTITPSNNVVYIASRTSNGHGDMASAFMMALTEVPENFNMEVKAVASLPPKPIESQINSDIAITYEEAQKRNRMMDALNKKKRKKKSSGF